MLAKGDNLECQSKHFKLLPIPLVPSTTWWLRSYCWRKDCKNQRCWTAPRGAVFSRPIMLMQFQTMIDSTHKSSTSLSDIIPAQKKENRYKVPPPDQKKKKKIFSIYSCWERENSVFISRMTLAIPIIVKGRPHAQQQVTNTEGSTKWVPCLFGGVGVLFCFWCVCPFFVFNRMDVANIEDLEEEKECDQNILCGKWKTKPRHFWKLIGSISPLANNLRFYFTTFTEFCPNEMYVIIWFSFAHISYCFALN